MSNYIKIETEVLRELIDIAVKQRDRLESRMQTKGIKWGISEYTRIIDAAVACLPTNR